MLFFLHFAARQSFEIASYQDQAKGYLEKNDDGKMAMTRVILRPAVVYSGDKIPDRGIIEKLHHAAHEHCFIANSVSTQVSIESDTA
ncbi:MAG: OsmC family protein [Gammaproteobacteria bacterium]|nr:OsmC family protein [Gammaproteobacteria bacterium]